MGLIVSQNRNKANGKPNKFSSAKPTRAAGAPPKHSAKPSSQRPTSQRFSRGAGGPPKLDPQKLTKNQRWVVGDHAVLEILKVRPKSVVKAFFQQGWQSLHLQNDIYNKTKSLGIQIEEKSRGFLDQIYMNHQGCILLAEGRPEFNEAQLTNPSQLVFLDGIEDPHNLGAICRTAWLLNVHGIFIPADRAVDITPTVHKVACGGVEHVPVSLETQFKNPIERFKELGYWVFGLSHKAEKNIFECQFPKQIVWCIGAEDKGLRSTTEKLCDDLVSIPQISASASYNASVATAMALSEGYRQHRYATSYR